MSDLVEVSSKDELKDGVMKKIMVKGRELLLVKVGGNIYCTHAH